jgi:coenzyme F420-0:L-glutamate ligase/coenzyme F420-1:gamma-L-glutamate ligase
MGIHVNSCHVESGELMPRPAPLEFSTYAEIQAIPVWGLDEVLPGDSIGDLIVDALALGGLRLHVGDILVVKHKIISKSEGRLVELASVKPSPAATRFAAKSGSDPRVIELAFREAKRVVRKKHVLITETAHGFVCANSGVDVSNVDGGKHAVLLPLDPDKSAATISRKIKKRTTLHIPVLIADSFGRAWREGLHEVAIGLFGMTPIHDYRGRRDSYGYQMSATEECVADELACVAGLVCRKNSGVPACIIRGYRYLRGNGSARQIVRSSAKDLFR